MRRSFLFALILSLLGGGELLADSAGAGDARGKRSDDDHDVRRQ